MNKGGGAVYCSQCGTKLEIGEIYCSQCGTVVVETTLPIMEVEPKKVYARKKESMEKTGASKKHESINGVKLFRRIAMGLIVLMTISATLKLAPFGEGLFKGKLSESETVVVSYENPKVSLAGIEVDVNSLNLIEGEQSLTVDKSEEEIGEDGFLGIEYEISLEDQHYLQAPLSITIPFDQKMLENYYVAILHYDKDYEDWIPLNTQLDQEEGTATAKLTSLSPVRMVFFDKDYSGALYYIENEGSIHAKMKVSYNYWDYIKNTPLEPATIVAIDYIANGNTLSSTEQMIKSGDQAINSVNTYYGLLGSFGDTVLSTVGLLAPAGSALEKLTGVASKNIGIVSLMIASGQLMYDLGTKDSTGPKNETAVNLYKNIASNSGTLYSFCTGYSSAAFTASFFAVAVTGFVLDSLVEEAKTIQASTVESIFNTYYQDYSTFNEEDWYRIFVDAYWDAWQNNKGSEEGMNYAVKKVTDAINTHAEKFWTEIYKEGSDALTFAVAEAGEKNYFTPTADQKAELTANFKKDLFQRFNEKAIPWINEFMQERMTEAVYATLIQAAEPFNKYYTVQIQEVAPEDSSDPCQFQNCPMRFAHEEGLSAAPNPKEWEILSPEDDDEWAVSKEFTLMGYLMMGAPDKLLIFDSKEKDLQFGKQIREETLVLKGEEEEYFTLIDLSVMDVDLSGEYELNGESTRTIKTPSSNGEMVVQSNNTTKLDKLLVEIKHRGKDMEIKIHNDFDTVLIGKYDEMTKTFNGRDSEGNFLYATEDTIVVFDVGSTPIKATGKLNVEKMKDDQSKLNLFMLDFTLTKIKD